MKKFPHEKFLEDNEIDYKTLPEMLYKRIKGFEELKEDLEHTTDEDKEKLTEKLEVLSHEILEDLEEHYEDQLENNDEEEEKAEEQQPVEEKIEEPQPIEEQVEDETQVEEPTPEPLKESTDEDVLKEFIANKKYLVTPEELRTKGFKTPLNGRTVMLGNLCLHKGKYDSCYKIVQNQ